LWKVEVGSWKHEAGSRRPEAGRWKQEACSSHGKPGSQLEGVELGYRRNANIMEQEA
jgi:hypothetical protein